MTDQIWNPWKMTAIALVLTVVTAVVTGVVIANWSGRDVEHKAETSSVAAHPAATARTTTPAPAAAPQPAAVPQPAALPSQATIDACNQHAAATSSQRSNTKEIVIDGAIGAVAGAAVGAAGGAIAGGGSGAGKGAAIGGVLGAGGGALYGVNENRKNDAQYRDVYAACMRARGYTG